jgi:soluble cytochrome b562
MSPSSSVPVPPTPSQIQITPSLVFAAYKRALRYGAYWRLRPEERAILLLARSLRAIKSLALREAILKILEKVWPSKATMIKAYEEGLKILARKIQLALAIGATHIAEALKKASMETIKTLGIQYINTPLFYRG